MLSMYKMQVGIFIGLIIVFGLLFFVVQKNSSGKSTLSPTPNPLPSGSDIFRALGGNNQQAQGDQQQQQPPQQQQQVPPTAVPNYNVPKELSASMPATLKTSEGNIQISLFGQDAPKTVQNFITKAQSGFYTNLTFHRVEDWVVQGGDPLGNGTGGGSMPVEFNPKPFVVGSIGMASTGNGQTQNDSQFFITKTDASWLNNQYTNFGIVTDGMDVVNKIKIGDKILGITIDE